MIEVSPNAALMLYLLFTLGALLIVWFLQHLRSRHRKIILSDKDLQLCEYCHFAYLAERHLDVSQCPQCQSFNKKHTTDS